MAGRAACLGAKVLEIRLLGGFEIRNGERAIDLPSRFAQSLFAYLILNRTTPHRREKLAGMFWPDAPEERARASLRHELWRIRKALSLAGVEDVLLSDDISAAFAPASAYRLDVACFEQVTEEASTGQLREALAVYRGELLPGFYDDWVVSERERLQRVFDQRMERLLALLEMDQCWTEMVEWAERWISLESSAEPAYRFLMAAYIGLGDRVKQFAAYERCVQALGALGLEPSDEIRALMNEARSASNLPAPLGILIGRETELAQVSELLRANRLVTLTGAGGVGKTRLAIEAARILMDRFSDGVCYVELAAVHDPVSVPERLRGQLRLRGVVSNGQSVTDSLCAHLRSRHVLLVLDNCEHLIEACADLVNVLLPACPGLHVLCTSREALRLPSESAYRVPSLELPSGEDQEDPARLASIASVRLFAERARARSQSFALGAENVRRVAEICMRLDGIPLAIELAAARIGTLPLQAMVDHLNDRFGLLSASLRTDVPRHKTLRAMIDWSHDLLSEPERVLLRRLSVFSGSWTLEAAQSIAGQGVLRENDVLGLLPELVEKSLVVLDSSTGRYHMLEIVREYALERLRDAAEEQRTRTRHLDYFLELAEEAELIARQSEGAHAKLAVERDNLLAALDWSQNCDDGIQKGLLLVGAARLTWLLLAEPDLGYRFARKLLAAPGAEVRNLARRRALLTMAHTGYFLGHGKETDWALEESIAICREIGDLRGEAVALNLYGGLLAEFGRREEGLRHIKESLRISVEGNFPRLISANYGGIADIHQLNGDLEAAQSMNAQAIAAIRQVDAPHDLILCLLSASQVAVMAGDLLAARSWLLEILELMCQIPYGFADAAPPLRMCGIFMAAEHDWRQAAVLFGAAERQRQVENRLLESGELLIGDPLIQQTCRELGPAEYRAAFAEGGRMPAAVAVRQAQTWLAATEEPFRP